LRTLTLGIVAHVDAGKTSLTERLLYEAGVLDAPGRVDVGTTQTDTMALERRRGITIRSAVVSFVVDGVTVNLVDTPGHSDFVAEVERALSVLDAAVLVVSAVEGVQAQTLALFRVLQRLSIPTLLFVNKIDRVGARPEAVVGEIVARLSPSVAVLATVTDAGTRAAGVRPIGTPDVEALARLAEAVAEHDETVLAALVDGDRPIGAADLLGRLARLTRSGLLHPVLFGSAITGAGVTDLLAALPVLLPARSGDPSDPPSGQVFKIERGPAGEKIVYLRLRAGTVRVRERLRLGADGSGRSDRVTGIRVFRAGGLAPAGAVRAGQIAQLRGLDGARVGDTVGAERPRDAQPTPSGQPAAFVRPSLETVVDPVHPRDGGALFAALTQLAEQDPLIGVRLDDARREISVSLYGEVQKEVIGSLLASEYGVEVTFRESTTVCIERVTGIGSAVDLIGTPANPFLATVGLRVEPAAVGSGMTFRLEVELGSMPPAFFTAVEDSARATLGQGVHGWEVPDCHVTMTHSGYYARPGSAAADFRYLTPLVLMTALRVAGTQVCEPIHRFELEIPAASYGGVLAALPVVGAVPLSTVQRGGTLVLTGDVPAAGVHALHQRLPDLTGGEGVLSTVLDHARPVAGVPPGGRARTTTRPTARPTCGWPDGAAGGRDRAASAGAAAPSSRHPVVDDIIA
jgi:ribosomal protection tetracycline resistance protein